MATLPVSTRYFRRNVTKIYYLPVIALANRTPTRPEIVAGTDLSPQIADINGWSVTSGTIDTPDLASLFTPQIGGGTSAESSSLTFYADKLGVDVRTVLPRGTVGYILICDGGDVPTKPADVFPISVTSLGKLRTLGDEAARIQVTFAITSQPAEDVILPA